MIKRENFGIECADIDGEISETIRTAGENDKNKNVVESVVNIMENGENGVMDDHETSRDNPLNLETVRVKMEFYEQNIKGECGEDDSSNVITPGNEI